MVVVLNMELGILIIYGIIRLTKLNDKVDWEKQLALAKERKFDEIDPGIQMRCWNNIQKIASHYDKPKWRHNLKAEVYWGDTGSGKSFKAFTENPDAYLKCPSTKWWDGYQGEKIVIVDEFRGQIGIHNILRWCDKYPCTGEIKGAQVPLSIEKIIFTSNLSPSMWYPELDTETQSALLRRLTVTHFNVKWKEPLPLVPVTPNPVPNNNYAEYLEKMLEREMNIFD